MELKYQFLQDSGCPARWNRDTPKKGLTVPGPGFFLHMNNTEFIRTLAPEQTTLFVELASAKAADLIKQGVEPEAAMVAGMEWARKQVENTKTIFDLIGPAQLAPILGLTRQRVHAMLKNMDSGDNRRRINEALREIARLIEKQIS